MAGLIFSKERKLEKAGHQVQPDIGLDVRGRIILGPVVAGSSLHAPLMILTLIQQIKLASMLVHQLAASQTFLFRMVPPRSMPLMLDMVSWHGNYVLMSV